MKVFSAIARLFAYLNPPEEVAVRKEVAVKPERLVFAIDRKMQAAHPEPGLAERLEKGRARESRIAEYLARADPAALPILAIRLYDWMPQVQQAARSAFMTLMPLATPAQLIALLPQIQWLRTIRTPDHSAWLAEFERELFRLLDSQVLIEHVNGANVPIRRACFDVLLRHPLIELSVLLQSALSVRADFVLASRAMALCAFLPPEEQEALCLEALASPFRSVRTSALQRLLADDTTGDRTHIALPALLDTQRFARAPAIRYLLAKRFDVRAHYLDVLTSPATPAFIIRIALASLGSLRHAGDAHHIRPFCKHALPSVRVEAYAAWLGIAPAEKDLIAHEAILDEARSVKKMALEMFTKHGAFIPFAAVRASLRAPENQDLLVRFARQSGQTLPAEA